MTLVRIVMDDSTRAVRAFGGVFLTYLGCWAHAFMLCVAFWWVGLQLGQSIYAQPGAAAPGEASAGQAESDGGPEVIDAEFRDAK